MTSAASDRFSRLTVEHGLKPLAISVVFVLVALLWTFLLQHVIAFPFVFLFFGAIMGSAWFGGFIAGFVAVLLSSLIITYFFVPPLFSMAVAKDSQSFLAAFILCAIAITVVSSARKRAESAIRDARDQLETKVQERTAELRQSNLEIKEKERQLRALTEAIPQQIWSADESGVVEYCNHDLLEYIGRSSEELRGEAFFAIFHREDVSSFHESWQLARVTGKKFEVQARVRGFDEVYRWFLVRSTPQRDSTGKVVRWYGVHIELEEQKQLQHDLESAQENLSRFSRTLSMAEMAASIAHQLNQPLTALIADAGACRRWLSAEPANLARATAAAERIARDSARASAVVSRVRSLFSDTDHVRESTDLNHLITELNRLLRDDAIRRGTSISLRLAEGLPRVNIDPVQIQQLLMNLATNGMDAMMGIYDRRALEIKTSLNGQEAVMVSVRDYGPGFKDEIKERIFEPFFTTKPHGTGMGLTICRSIVEAHGGTIWVENCEPGAVIHFALKVSE
jgi:PAS domain S-box-containing protein